MMKLKFLLLCVLVICMQEKTFAWGGRIEWNPKKNISTSLIQLTR